MTAADAYVDEESRFTWVNGVRVHFKREGSGPPLLLLHGSGSSLQAFDPIADDLKTVCEVIRLDLPAFGLTGPRPDRDYRIEAYVSFVVEFLAGLGLDKLNVAGSSLGGNIAWNLAVAHPQRVQKLVLMNATGYPEKSLPKAMRLARNPLLRPLLRRWAPSGAAEQNLRSSVGPRMHVDQALVDRVTSMMSRPGNRSAFIDFANTDQPDRSGRIPEITAPTLVLRSDLIDGQHFHRDIPGSREAVLTGIGHLMPEEAPAEISEAIRSHLKLPSSTTQE
ncbi:alpha/beta fold hydrolase [Streptomyces sp. NBC_01244]|uniref:alpha/beta fold hydrolase n=1 Tax=Streptomyces sp. NBC_01244 TaxID=2903797 RepID=UPI002E11A265|nr:alpha/beta hydrolase [Streptomyces sp. NBC_01244]